MENEYLNEFDPRLKSLLWTGKLSTPTGEKTAILKSVNLDPPKRFHFELHYEIDAQKTIERPSLFKSLFISTRPFSLTATATPGLVVLGAGIILEGWKANFFLFALSLLSVVLLQAAVNLLNDVYDHLKGIDFPGDLGGSGVIQKGWLSAKALFIFATILSLAAIVLGILPLYSAIQKVWWIGLLGLVGGLGYSGLGLGLKYRSLGDLTVFVLCGPALTAGFSYVTFGEIGPSILYSGLIFGFAALGILHSNNLNDLEIDLKRGARTVANQIGFKRSQKYFSLIYFSIFVIALVAPIVANVSLYFSFAPLLLSFIVWKLVNKVKQASGPLSPSLSLIRFETSKLHLLVGLSLMFGLLISFWVKA